MKLGKTGLVGDLAQVYRLAKTRIHEQLRLHDAFAEIDLWIGFLHEKLRMVSFFKTTPSIFKLKNNGRCCMVMANKPGIASTS